MKVLGVDDNPDILSFIQMIVEMMGHQFESASGGQEGLDMIRNNQYDVVFLDLQMPEVTGIDVINALIDEDKIQKQKVIMFTASYIHIDENIKALAEAGHYMILQKPADVEEIMELIEAQNKK